jgi:MOSC domain-containing protein YiiM
VRVEQSSGLPEDGWVGRELHIGSYLVITVTGRGNDMCLGVYGRVVQVGRVRVGDPVELV